MIKLTLKNFHGIYIKVLSLYRLDIDQRLIFALLIVKLLASVMMTCEVPLLCLTNIYILYTHFFMLNLPIPNSVVSN